MCPSLLQGISCDLEYELKYDICEWLNIYLKWEFMGVRCFQLFLPYLIINQKKDPIIFKIMKVENIDTATYFNPNEKI